jgi:hypothetical protein
VQHEKQDRRSRISYGIVTYKAHRKPYSLNEIVVHALNQVQRNGRDNKTLMMIRILLGFNYSYEGQHLGEGGALRVDGR